eukprot:752752-Hanusia_phi.AAC.4
MAVVSTVLFIPWHAPFQQAATCYECGYRRAVILEMSCLLHPKQNLIWFSFLFSEFCCSAHLAPKLACLFVDGFRSLRSSSHKCFCEGD